MDLSFSEEQQALAQTAREFTRKEIVPKAGHFDESGEVPKEILKKAWETGLMNIEIPEAYGGVGGPGPHNPPLEEEGWCWRAGANTSMAAKWLRPRPRALPP